MPVPSSISDLSQTANSNSPDGSESPNTADDYLRTLSAFIATLRDGKGFTDPVVLASGGTTDIGASNAMFVQISGTTTITSFGTNYNGPRFLRFEGALTLTHSSSLNLPGAANITTEAGDTCIAIPNSTPNGWNVVQYQRADLAPGAADSATNAVNVTGTIASGVTGTTQSAGDNSTKIATTAYVDGSIVQATTTVRGTVELATDAEVQTGTDTSRVPSVSSFRNGLLVQGTSQATTSGTTIPFTGIPSWAKRVQVVFNGVGTDTTSEIMVQLGTSSGYENTGYAGATLRVGAASNFTTGFWCESAKNAADELSGVLTLTKLGTGDIWIASGSTGVGARASAYSIGGTKTLSGTLDRLRLNTVSGTGNFDNGSVNILYE